METMTTDAQCLELDVLFGEIGRYLAAVEVFREQGCEPRWSSGEFGPAALASAVFGPATTA
jgi:hypothetical protein